jgi:hypothetical protein
VPWELGGLSQQHTSSTSHVTVLPPFSAPLVFKRVSVQTVSSGDKGTPQLVLGKLADSGSEHHQHYIIPTSFLPPVQARVEQQTSYRHVTS